jgi:hypothetical protein|tara:strand:+ start:1153 stop:1305 length:153 start_codon:yes stop_codon:yes gene_type:complete
MPHLKTISWGNLRMKRKTMVALWVIVGFGVAVVLTFTVLGTYLGQASQSD